MRIAKWVACAGALRYHADSVISALERLGYADIARRLLCRMVWIGEKSGETASRRVPMQALIEESPDPEVWGDVLRRLTDGRLVLIDGDRPNATAELVHDSLTVHWSWLQTALQADRDFLVWRQMLNSRITEWRHVGRDPAALLSGTLLARAGAWLESRESDLTLTETAFIRESHQQTRAEQDFLSWRTTRLAMKFAQWDVSGRLDALTLEGAPLGEP